LDHNFLEEMRFGLAGLLLNDCIYIFARSLHITELAEF
jgi:hypothetical protein